MNCRDIRDNLTPYLLGDLDPARAAEVRAHVQDCAACRAEAEDMQAALQFLRKSLADTPGTPAQLPEKFTRQFQKRNRRRPRVVRQGAAPRRWRFRIVEFAAVAAILLVLAGLLLPNTASVRERARRVNDLSNLNGLWKAASAWGLEPVNTWRPAFPESIDDVMKEGGLTPEFLVNTETKQPVEYYPGASGASDTDGNRPLLVSRGKTGRNVVTVSGQGRWVADGTPEAEALNRQLAELPKQVATVTPGSFARKGGAKRAPAGPAPGNGAASLPANKPGKGGAVPEDTREKRAAFTDESGAARARGESGVKEEREKKGEPESDMDSSINGQEVARLAKVRDFQKAWSVKGSTRAVKAQAAEQPQSARPADEKTQSSSTLAGDKSDTVLRDSDRYEQGRGGAVERFEMVRKLERAEPGKDAIHEITEIDARMPAKEPEAPRASAVTAPPPEPAQSDTPPVPVCRAIGVNQFVAAAANPFSTFSIDVDTASYTLSRNYILRGQLPPPEAVRTEEFVNFFDYDYAPPAGATFGVYTDCGPSAFGRGKSLLKIGVKGRRLGREEKRAAALTLLIDTSGSMATPDRIELVKSALSLMVERLDPADRVAIVQYDSHARLLLEHTPAAEKKRIIGVIESLQTSGSTALEEGMRAAYAAAARGFDGSACNRVLLLSDGMANLGAAAAEEILNSVAGYRKQGITLSVFGFGLGAYNDDMLETLADKGDGVYAFIDSPAEARRALVDDLAATINLIARDVKIQVEFDPKRVRQYRQLGYENRQLKKEQFRDDSVDAGEIGSGQSVTALYELELQGEPRAPLGIVRVRCRNALTGQIEEIEQPVAPPRGAAPFEDMDVRFRLAAAAAEYAEILRGSPFAAGSGLGDVARVLRPVALELSLDNRIQEFLRMAEMGLTPKFQEAGPP